MDYTNINISAGSPPSVITMTEQKTIDDAVWPKGWWDLVSEWGNIPRKAGGCLIFYAGLVTTASIMSGNLTKGTYDCAEALALIGAAAYYMGDRMSERAYRNIERFLLPRK